MALWMIRLDDLNIFNINVMLFDRVMLSSSRLFHCPIVTMSYVHCMCV